MKVSIAIIGEFDGAMLAHPATDRAIMHSAAPLQTEVDVVWVPTTEIDESLFADFDGIWMSAGDAYADMEASLWAIRHARENPFPCLGTCRGFQHMVLEFARNALGITDAGHEEYDAKGNRLVVTRLPTSLAGRRRPVAFAPDSKLVQIYQADSAIEKIYGDYGVNPQVEQVLAAGGFRSMASESSGAYRAAGISDHPFFVGTLFVPQMRSTKTSPHPLVTAFLKAAIDAHDVEH